MIKFSLSTYLMLSVLIILSGILWILFTQVDRSYEYQILFPDLQREQDEIIRKVYQQKPQPQVAEPQIIVQTPAIQPIPQPVPEKPVKNSQVVEPVELSQALSVNNQYYDVWGNPINPDYETEYFLRNNPWSPHYKPGY